MMFVYVVILEDLQYGISIQRIFDSKGKAREYILNDYPDCRHNELTDEYICKYEGRKVFVSIRKWEVL